MTKFLSQKHDLDDKSTENLIKIIKLYFQAHVLEQTDHHGEETHGTDRRGHRARRRLPHRVRRQRGHEQENR